MEATATKARGTATPAVGVAPSKEGRARKESGMRSGMSRGERNAQLGKRGEDAAARFLVRHGYEIAARNWTCAAGEADIIARDGSDVVFVEVKTRSSPEKGAPAEAVDARKRSRYGRIATLYLERIGLSEASVRFDIVSVVPLTPDRAKVRHYINAFSVEQG